MPLPPTEAGASLLCPVAAFSLAWRGAKGASAFSSGEAHTACVLILDGVVTALPLLWFASAAERRRLATLGLFRYLARSGHFLLAVVAYGGPFTPVHGVALVCIWIALAVYSLDTQRGKRT